MKLPGKEPKEHIPGQPTGWRDLTLAAAWLGLVSGLLEGVLYLGLQHWQLLEWDEALISVGPQQILISALTNIGLFTIVAAPLAWMGAWVRWRHWPRVILGLLVFLSLLALIDLSGRIQLRASLILALGLTVQAIRWMAPRQSKVLAQMRRTLLPLAGATASAGLAVWLGGPMVEQIQASRLPPAPASPNVLLIVLDTVRADRLSSYGYDRPTTPNLDALATQSIQFEHAYATSSWTLPTHASLMTGLLPSEHGATVRRTRSPLHSRFPVLSEALAARGYTTGGFVANTTWLTPWMGLHRGFLHYESHYFSLLDAFRRTFFGRQIWRTVSPRLGRSFEPRPSAPHLISALESWLDRMPRRPYFVFLNFMEAHAPNPVPPSYRGRFRGTSPKSRVHLGEETLTEARREFRERWSGEYDSALSYLDSQLGVLFDQLRQRGQFENTLIIVTSDHGEAFGRHGLFDHANALYEELIHVPLIVRLPGGINAGLRIPQRVSLRDVPATAMDILGFTPHSLGGHSLAEFWRNPSAPGRPVIAEVDGAPFPDVPPYWPVRKGWLKSIIKGEWKLILHEDGSVELYDLAKDRLEKENLASNPMHSQRIHELRSALGPS